MYPLINQNHFGPIGMNSQFDLCFGAKANKGVFPTNRLKYAVAEDLLKIPKLKQGRKNKFDLCHTLQPFSFLGGIGKKNYGP